MQWPPLERMNFATGLFYGANPTVPVNDPGFPFLVNVSVTRSPAAKLVVVVKFALHGLWVLSIVQVASVDPVLFFVIVITQEVPDPGLAPSITA